MHLEGDKARPGHGPYLGRWADPRPERLASRKGTLTPAREDPPQELPPGTAGHCPAAGGLRPCTWGTGTGAATRPAAKVFMHLPSARR